MPDIHLLTLLAILKDLGTPLTRPGFANLLVIAVGWIQSYGGHAVTQALVVTDVAGRRHHEAFHRFFSRGSWDPDAFGYWMFRKVERWLDADGNLRVVIDDTLAPKKGPHVFGIGSHLDAVRSTRRQRIFCFGHCWVVLSVTLHVPFSRRVWALPILFRLYRNKKECAKNGGRYRKKTELAREMLDVLLGWTNRRIEVAADSAYCNDTVMRGLPDRLHLFGSMRPDAVLTALPTDQPGAKAGRPRKRGDLLPKPEAIAKDDSKPWKSCRVFVYRREVTIRYKTLCAQWYRACGTRLLRIVIVATEGGAVPYRVFFSTDATLDVPTIIASYGARWSIECFFREAKQFLGFADSQARKEQAVLRVAPFVGLLYSVLVLWFLEGASASRLAAPPLRPWYQHKRGFSFEDILRAARRATASLDVLDPGFDIENLHQLRARSGNTEPAANAREKLAA
jgi:DDE superfamily endonuclease